MNKRFCTLVFSVIVLVGCAQTHVAEVNNDKLNNNLTVGKVQREIKTGMPGAEVIAMLGSPNIVTRDRNKSEVWVYDKISTNYAFSNSSGKIALTLFDWKSREAAHPEVIFGANQILGGARAVAQAGGTEYGRNAGATSINQRTLTIIIKLDNNGLVDDFTYHASSF